jgi:hypothetical protein
MLGVRKRSYDLSLEFRKGRTLKVVASSDLYPSFHIRLRSAREENPVTLNPAPEDAGQSLHYCGGSRCIYHKGWFFP